jgi:hypothetical protein
MLLRNGDGAIRSGENPRTDTAFAEFFDRFTSAVICNSSPIYSFAITRSFVRARELKRTPMFLTSPLIKPDELLLKLTSEFDGLVRS